MRTAFGLSFLACFSLLIGCGGSPTHSTPPTTTYSTTTALTASPNPAAAGATVTLTAAVTAAASGSAQVPVIVPSGAVSFYDGTTLLGTATLTSGSGATAAAVYTTSTLAASTTHTLTASYAGTSTLPASTSSAVALVINAPAPSPTTTALTASPNPAAAGATVTLTATVTSSAGTPTGTITFLDGASTLGTASLTNGIATLTTSTLTAGTTQSLTASYTGTSSYAASTSNTISEVINAATNIPTTTALTASPNPATAGATVTLTATVTSSNTTETPTGSVNFKDGTTLLGTVALGASSTDTATATYTTTTLSAATHSLTATYPGDTTFLTSTSSTVSLVVNSAINNNATFSFTSPNQTILGFGGAEAFYANYLDNHPNESQIMSALYDPVNGLGITFLRLANNYYNYTGTNATTFDPDDPAIFTAATTALGAKPTVLMSSWTPPANLKSNNSLDGCTGVTNGNCTSGFGTLAQVGGAYNYAGFGQYWLSSLEAYAALGVSPNYISIQNEPDFPATYVACLFNPTDTTPAELYQQNSIYASYGKAFDATYQAINGSPLASIPQMIGPESFSLYNAQALLTQVPTNELAVVASHLYNVSSYGGSPTGQITPMTTFASDYPNPQQKWATEYFQTPGFYNAIDIHNALTVANDNVYLYWALAWPSTLANGISTDQQGLLYIDNPFNSQSTWAYPSGWTYNDAYYALKGYSLYIRPGYIRYNATSSNPDEDISVYQSPDTKTTVIVLLNTSTTATDTVGLTLSNITYTTSQMFRSSFATPITTAGAERWNPIGAYTTQGITMPPQSEVTVLLTN
ncbi:MAG: Ig-like domain repeat protein [Acidobacteriaceae bacterium]